jgi:hypothetical protein
LCGNPGHLIAQDKLFNAIGGSTEIGKCVKDRLRRDCLKEGFHDGQFENGGLADATRGAEEKIAGGREERGEKAIAQWKNAISREELCGQSVEFGGHDGDLKLSPNCFLGEVIQRETIRCKDNLASSNSAMPLKRNESSNQEEIKKAILKYYSKLESVNTFVERDVKSRSALIENGIRWLFQINSHAQTNVDYIEKM